MPRTSVKAWVYDCDAMQCAANLGGIPADLKVQLGDACSTGRGFVVHDQADADAHARSIGWQLTHGGRQVFCPACTGKGGAA